MFRRSVVSVGDRRRRSSSSRIYGSRDLEDDFLLGELEKETRPVLAKIERCYRRLKNQKLVYGGFCFGLLDPASNICVNCFMSPDVAVWDCWEDARGGTQATDMNKMHQRSLDGLLAFLTRLFPYLPKVEALRYLDVAEADPLLASLLIINHRGIEQSFKADSGATVAAVEAALRCAAIAARHPDPQELVLGWKLVSPDLKKLLPELKSNLSVLRIRLAKMTDPGASDRVLQLKESWELARSRLHRAKPRVLRLPPVRAARKRVLLATIHGFYLQALARLPKDELCTRYQQSLLKAGHCYGPLDPVSNIIVNTVWYDKAFPPSKQVTICMVSTRSLLRIVARSLYGLVSFMCTRYPDCTPDQVLQRLLEANADLRVADPTLVGDNADQVVASCRTLGCEVTIRSVTGRSTPATSLQVAYTAAATAACHPVPHEQQALLGSPDSLLKLQVACMQVLHKDCLLSSQNVEILASLLVSPAADEPHQQPQPEPIKVDKLTLAVFSSQCLRFRGSHEKVLRQVKIALARFNRDKVDKYKFHFICGVNEMVSGPEYNRALCSPGNPSIYRHTHINFLATCKDSQSAHAPATLFFAECGNYSSKETWCLPVNLLDQGTERVRCIYCEDEGIVIVHLAVKGFYGRDREFEKVQRGEALFPGLHKSQHDNHKLLYGWTPDELGSVVDDCIYNDYVLDPNATEYKGLPPLMCY